MRNLLTFTAAASVLAIGISTQHTAARSTDAEASGPNGGLQRVQMGGEPIGPGPPPKAIPGGKPSAKKIKRERAGKRR